MRLSHRRGFIFTLDALMGIAIAIVAVGGLVAVSGASGEDVRVGQVSYLARDYLVLKYSLNRSVLAGDVAALTNRTLVESAPSQAGAWMRADLLAYGKLLDCDNILSCEFANTSSQAAYLQKSDIDKSRKLSAWVKAG